MTNKPKQYELNAEKIPYLNDPDAIVTAASLGEYEVVMALLDKGVHVDTQDEFGRTALLAAIEETYYPLAGDLLRRGANPNIPNSDGDTPLDLAKYSDLYRIGKDDSMVTALLKAGGLCKEGPSFREQQDDAIYGDFESANAVKTLLSLTKNKR